MKPNRRALLAATVVAAVTIGASSVPARAEILVLGGSGRGVLDRYPVGSILQKGDVVLTSGESIDVVINGKMKKIVGPVRLTAKPGKPAKAGLLDKLAGAARRVESRRVTLGAVRGSGRASSEGRDAWAVDVTASDTFCIQDPRKLSLWRGDTAAAARVSLEDMKEGTRVFFDWPKGAAFAPWPEVLRPRADGNYLFRAGTGAARQFQIHLVPGGLRDLELLAAFADRDCLSQFEIAIEAR